MVDIRDIKIDLLLGAQNPIVDLFQEIAKDLRILNCNVYNEDGLEFIYFNKENQWIFFQDAKNGKFWAHYKRYWERFEYQLQLKYKEIQALTKFLVEDALLREVDVSNFKDGFQYRREVEMVEEALKREGIKTVMFDFEKRQVEDVLKRGIDKPSYLFSEKSTDWVDEVIKKAKI